MLLSPRYLPRLAAMVGLFTRYGLADFAQRQGLHALAPEELDAERDDHAGDTLSARERAVAFRKRLVELGPAYVKLGQVLSTRADLLPPAYIEELEHLQDDVGTVPLDQIEETIERELGARIGKLFASFDPEPLASASLGQVHAAELRDGRQVVVKVQRPDIRGQLAGDLEFFAELARFASDHTRMGERMDMVGIVQQLEHALADELDYRVEARNAASFRRALSRYPHLLIPRVIEAYSTERVLTMERVRGIKVSEIPAVSRVERDFRTVADEFAKAYLEQITIAGHFHADPHPGNVLVLFPEQANPRTPAELSSADRRRERRPAATSLARLEQEAEASAGVAAPPDEPKLALIDFGMTAHLSTSLRERIVTILLDLADDRGDDVAAALIEIGDATDDFDRTAYVRQVSQLVTENYDRSVGELQAGAVIYEIIDTSFRSGLRLPAELTMLAKALFNLDAVSRALDPTFNPVDAIREFGRRIVASRARRELSPRRIYQIATQASNLLDVLPRRVDRITDRLASGDLGVKVDAPQLGSLLNGLQKVANRILSGLVLCGLLIASAMLMPYRRQLGTAGFVIAAAVGIYMVINILISDRHGRA
ncbi:MAG TPA: AarF/UbiB family protein [Gemmatimonadaceae bacterium]|nr:AarF/UbiB family protein [Gemmatimonadaceae bacterium]